MKATLQMLSLFLAIVSVLISLRTCFDGWPAKKPSGYTGLLISFVLYGLMFFLSYCCGSYSEIFGEMWP